MKRINRVPLMPRIKMAWKIITSPYFIAAAPKSNTSAWQLSVVPNDRLGSCFINAVINQLMKIRKEIRYEEND